MLKATLQFTDCCGDNKNVFGTLSKCGVQIIKSKFSAYTTTSTVTILVVSYDQLSSVLDVLNKNSLYGVSLLKVKRKWF